MNKFLERHKLSKLTEEIENLKRLVTNQMIELVNKKFPTKKSGGLHQSGFHQKYRLYQ